MSINDETIRSRKEIKKRLLRRAFDEGRGAEVIAEIQKRVNRVRDLSETHKEILDDCRINNYGQPRVVQMLNALARHEGSSERWIDTSNPPAIN
jgi:hypothetical protein